VSFYDGSTLIATVAVNGDGVATYVDTNLGAGNDSITAVFDGDGNFATSTSTVVVQVVNQAKSQAGAVMASSPQTFYGENVVLTATFSATSDGAPLTGTVMFYDGTTFLGTSSIAPPVSAPSPVPVSAAPGASLADEPVGTVTGQASLPTPDLSVGNHTIKAVYSGDANYSTATSETPVSVLVVPATTSTSIAANTNASGTTLTATVVVTSPGNPPLTGTVSFFDGTTLLATEPLVNGQASYFVGILGTGSHSFSAVYSGGGTSSASKTDVPITIGIPTVASLARFGYHAQPTYLVVGFTDAMNETTVENVKNYEVFLSSARGKKIGAAIKAKRAVYNPTTQAVTLSFAERLDLHKTYTITVIGSTATGIVTATGVPLLASAAGQPGKDYTQTFTGKILAGSASELPGKSAAAKAARGHAADSRAHTNVIHRVVHALIRRRGK
jgi:hypothetical protein